MRGHRTATVARVDGAWRLTCTCGQRTAWCGLLSLAVADHTDHRRAAKARHEKHLRNARRRALSAA